MPLKKMPKSKRNKLIHLTATEKKTRESKSKLIDSIRSTIDSYKTCILFIIENSRTIFIQKTRSHFSDSKFFFGKNKILAKALGTSVEEEISPGIHELALKINGNIGLMFTNQSLQQVEEYFNQEKMIDFARCGGIATTTISIKAGALQRGSEPLPHNMEPLVRSCGLPTTLVKGVVTLLKDSTIVSEGDTINTSQAQLLKIFGIKMAECRLRMLGVYNVDDGFRSIL